MNKSKIITNFVRRISSIDCDKGKYQLYLVRNGENKWVEDERYCGWYNNVLAPKARKQIVNIATQLKRVRPSFDLVATSALDRSYEGLKMLMGLIQMKKEPEICRSWRLNPRHYGILTGKTRDEVIYHYGYMRAELFRRGYYTKPPPMPQDHPLYNNIRSVEFHTKIQNHNWTDGESIQDCLNRVVPIWNMGIAFRLKEGCKVLVLAHEHSLQGIIKCIWKLTPEEIMSFSIPRGVVMVAVLDENMKPKKPLQFLDEGGSANAKKAIALTGSKVKRKKPKFG